MSQGLPDLSPQQQLSKPEFNGEWVKLGDLCGVCSGGTPKRSVSEYWNEGSIPWVKISDISGKFVSSTEELITEAGLKGSSAKLLAPGTLLYSIFASIGAVGILKIPAATNQAIAGLSIKTDRIERDYLYHFLKSRESLAKSSGRGAAQNNINLTILRGMEVPVPAIGEQKAIVEQLEIIATQIKQAETQLDQLDSLVKSQFVEMFGDPKSNPHGWDIGTIETIAANLDAKRVPITQSDREEGPYPYYGATGAVDSVSGYIFDERLLLVSEDGANLLARTYPIAFSIFGKTWVNNHAHVLKVQNEETQVFLEKLINMMDISEFITGSTQPKLTQKQLNQIPVMLPPMSLQRQFAEFVARVDKLGFDCCREIVCCGVLFSSMSASLLCT